MTPWLDHHVLPLELTLTQLPPKYPHDAQTIIEDLLCSSTPVNRLVVLDDDPTGTQTCHNIAVLSVWDHLALVHEFRHPSGPGFFILTNSRALPPSEAEELVFTICRNIALAAKTVGLTVDIVLRGDSTLRGHFPLEANTAQKVFGNVDAWILAPFFLQGVRYTIDDVHYVAENGKLVPAGSTQFARDATFGYKSSNLRDYIMEKAPGKFTKEQLHSISIADIRLGGPQRVCDKLMALPSKNGGVVIVNAAAEEDMHVFVAGLLLANSRGKRFLYRTGAAFVSTRLGIRSKLPLTATELKLPNPRQTGGLIIAGSYVPKTTAQLMVLTERFGQQGSSPGDLAIVELSVHQFIASPKNKDETIQRTVREAELSLQAGRDTLFMTSRKLITGHDGLSSLAIGSKVAGALVGVLRRIQVRPRYVIAKGGITSSDAATRGLNIKRAMILGQAAPGIPLWQCNERTSRHPGVPFVVFPGNVGEETTLADLVEAWH